MPYYVLYDIKKHSTSPFRHKSRKAAENARKRIYEVEPHARLGIIKVSHSGRRSFVIGRGHGGHRMKTAQKGLNLKKGEYILTRVKRTKRRIRVGNAVVLVS